MKKWLPTIFVVIATVIIIIVTVKAPEMETSNMNQQPQEKSLPTPELTIDQSKEYSATLETSEGSIVIKLNAQSTPITTNNFVYLTNNDFYNDTIFHRIIEGFMIQGGDPTGTGSGSPGYRFDDEPVVGEYIRGTVAMANAGPNTNGSQFFIMHQAVDLPKNYVIFGLVTDGLDVIDKIATAEVAVNSGGEQSKPVTPVTIKQVTIEEK